MGPKKKFPCPNPLFLQWLEEWKQEAEEKGLNSKWTYQKAITSLRRYPLPLISGKEAKILENIGDGIAKKLDKKLEEFIRNGGDLSELHAQVEEPAPKRRRRKKDPENEFQLPKSPNNVSNNMKSPTRRYIPKYRSGPYAILIALYNESKKSTYVGFLTKVELQLLAQPLCDTSLTVPDPGSHYTAWSSMANLLKKRLVLKWSNPAKFNITSTGTELAEKLLNGLQESNNSTYSNTMVAETIPDSTPEDLLHNLQDIVNELNTSGNHSKSYDEASSNTLKPGSHFARLQESLSNKNKMASNTTHEAPTILKYWYVTESGRCTSLKSQALVTIDGELNGIGFLTKVKKKDLEISGLLYKYDNTRSPRDGYSFAYLADQGAKEIATVPEEPTVQNNNNSIPSTKQINTKVTNPKPSSSTKTSKQINPQPSQFKPSSTISSKEITSQSSSTTIVKPQSGNILPNFSSNSKTNEKTVVNNIINHPSNPLFTLRPGMFEVILLVDTVETSGGGKRKKEMAENLLKTGVKMEVRKLQLGDFFWIAKEKFGSQREVVLDFVLERKRMDDLASSIIDGRFKEQKFRLKSCGLMKLIYLVEQYGSVEHFVVPESTLKQAIMNTQIVDDLFVKETNSIQDSVEYLRIMTIQLIKLYKDKTIHAHNLNDVKTMKSNSSFEDVIAKTEQHLIPYEEFSSNSDKNKVLTVREMFAKQLMQIKGISADRAVAIVDQYPTPTCYVAALDGLSYDDKMNLLTNITFGKAKRKIGLPISKQVFLHYTTLNSTR